MLVPHNIALGTVIYSSTNQVKTRWQVFLFNFSSALWTNL